MTHDASDITQVLLDVSHHRDRADRLMELVYDDIKAIAKARLADERSDHTLQPTALVHEAYLRLVDQSRVDWRSRAHFVATASMVIRRILVDAARRKQAAKRGGDWTRIDIDPSDGSEHVQGDLLDLEAALEELGAVDERAARVVEMRAFGGLGFKDIAEVLSVTQRTVERDWSTSRAWLMIRLETRDAAS